MTNPSFDGRPSVRFDNTAPENPKLEPLSDAAFRLWFNLICWCSRQKTNGRIPAAILKKRGRPKLITELMNARDPADPSSTPLLIKLDDTYLLHDYLMHQRSAEEIESFTSAKSESGLKGAHMRWHVPTRKPAKDCSFCHPEEATANG